VLRRLGLNGRLRPVPGVIPAVTAAQTAGVGAVVVTAEDAAGAAPVPGIRVIAASSLTAAD
jgi:magnesium chelatase family protein